MLECIDPSGKLEDIHYYDKYNTKKVNVIANIKAFNRLEQDKPLVNSSIHNDSMVCSQSIGSEKISSRSAVELRSNQDQLYSRRVVDTMIVKKDWESHSERYKDSRRVVDTMIVRKDGESHCE